MQKIFPLLVAVFALLATGCHRAKKQPARMPPLEVEVIRAELDSVPNRMSFIGYLASNFNAVIQPRVSGYLTSKRYSNGMPVKRGQLLFTIDPDQLSTTLLSARASLESARAQAVEAKNNYERAVPLARINAISQTQLDQYTAQYAAAQAAVHSAEQTFNNARLEVGYTKIYAPIDGMIETTSAHVGDYVGPGTQFEVLTTISNLDTMLVDLALPMAQYLRYSGNRPSIYENADLLSDITLRLANDSIYPIPGLYDYTRKNISNTMGTIVIVVMFPNPDLTLKPGQFARVTADVGATRLRVVVPQRSVSQAQGVGRTARQHGRIPACGTRSHLGRRLVHRFGGRGGRNGARYGTAKSPHRLESHPPHDRTVVLLTPPSRFVRRHPGRLGGLLSPAC